jgi:hypothetical protein
MKHRELTWGRVWWSIALVFAMGSCAGEGCACMGEIPDGFPAGERQVNAVQARVTPSALQFFSDNFDVLEEQLFPDGLEFEVPPSCNTDPKVCCYVPYGYCGMSLNTTAQTNDLPRLELEASGDRTVELTLRGRLRTNVAMPVHTPGLFGEIECYVSVNSAWSGTPHIAIRADLHLSDDPDTGALRIDVGDTSLYGVSTGDVSIAGGLLCGFGSEQEAADNVNSQIRNRIGEAVEGFLCSKCTSDSDCSPFGTCGGDGTCEIDGQSTCMQHFGTSGRLAADTVLGLLPTDDAGEIDLYLAAGGYAQAGDGGMAVGVRTGVLSSQDIDTHDCVPVVPAPSIGAIGESATLAGNTHPATGEPFDIGLGIHTAFLDQAGWAAHQAGFLCLDVGTEKVPLLTASAISILAPSVIDLIHEDDAPLYLQVRPQTAPTMTLGAGTFVDTPGGVEVDEALVNVAMKDLEVDFYLLTDDRYVRILTLLADLTIPLGLDVDGTGDVIPVLGDVAEAFENIRVKNSGLLAETHEEIADKFPAILSIALPGLADGLGSFQIPEFAGLTLALGPGGFTAVDGDQFLAILGNLAVSNTAASIRTAHTTVDVLGIDGDAAIIELALGADGVTGPVEWQMRHNGGFWSPFTQSPEVSFHRDGLRVQGRHTIEVRARVVGEPATADPQPAAIDVIVDAIAPRILATDTGDAVLIDASDFISPPDALTVRTRIDGGAWTDVGAPPVSIDKPGDGHQLEVEVSDEAGNSAGWSTTVGFHGSAEGEGCGDCRLGGGGAGSTGTILVMLFVVAGLSRRFRRGTLAAVAALAFATTGCGGDPDGGDDDPLDPTVVNPGPTGRYASISTDGDRVLLAAYEQNFGDLVVAEIADEGEPTFEVIAGAPAEPVVLDPDGYRGGVNLPGENVGAWTASAMSGSSALIAYQDIDAARLMIAVEADGWASHAIDSAPDGHAGIYASIAVDSNGLAAIAYMALVPIALDPDAPEDALEMMTVELRLASATTPTPSSAADWAVEVIDAAVVEAAPEFHDIPTGVGLFSSVGFLSDGTAVVSYYDQVEGDLMLAVRDIATGEWRPEEIAGASGDHGQWASMTIAPDDTVWLAYQDANADQLLVRSWVSGQRGPVETIDDGRRDDDRPHSVGPSARILFDDDGALCAVYQDSTASDLRWARRDGDGIWSGGDLLAGDIGYGFHVTAAAAGGRTWVTSYVYDQSSWPPGHTTATLLP